MLNSAFSNGSVPLLATVDFQSPILWAVVVGYILSTTLHELSHGVVAYLGGDYTIRERGGLTLNPIKYMHPVMSIIIPLFFLLMGGVPLLGGATYIRRDLLRNRAWETAVSLAGPATNFLLFLLLALLLHPKIGWIHPSPLEVSEWTSVQLFLGAMLVLQFLTGMLNLLPLPPLDGFGAIRPYFDPKTQAILSSPQVAMGCLFAFFFLMPNQLFQGIYHLGDSTLAVLGFDEPLIDQIRNAFNKVLYNR
jgi:Zn-dependent protease